MKLYVTPIEWRRETGIRVDVNGSEHIAPIAALGVARCYREIRKTGMHPVAARMVVARLLGIGWVTGWAAIVEPTTPTPAPPPAASERAPWRVLPDRELEVLGS